MNEYIEIDSLKIPIRIYYENRKNVRASIGKRGVHIRIPKYLDSYSKKTQLKKMRNWAWEIIRNDPRRFKPENRRNYYDGDSVKVGKKEYILKIRYKDIKSCSGSLEGMEIRLNLSSELTEEEQSRTVPMLLSRIIGKDRLPLLEEMINNLNRRLFKVKIGKVSFRYNRSNWGSCSPKGNISISTRLLLAPLPVMEYVCVHELAHIIEPNHSQKFWILVERAMPDYKGSKKWLKENRNKLWF